MTKLPPMTQTTISSTTAQTHFGRIIRQACKDKAHFVIERNDLPVVVILSVSEYEALLKNRRAPEEKG